ncbi:FecR domain-containing protein [Pseudodesulfovibrio sp. zrk46]|uniref:FecR domain-containing protein n=1 Tax=Pseudodesulfovibrio sp. zrk46 TaxID=2725288 RepID=UPI001448B513|nr:FecR domain-containing protein [Pseudodesulfovibrio sp. zrk46]QJB56858.1 hypothetical protein HFN16_10775 [Pseudodesulfovibrio sp. zrk46]
MAEPIGNITTVHGSAMAEGVDGVRTLESGSPVYEDETIITKGAGSALEITFTDGSLLSQGPNSTSVLDEYIFDPNQDTGEMALSLVEGTFRSVTGSIVDINPEGFHVDTPLATIGIRGTIFGIRILPPAKPGDAPTIVVGAIDFDGKPIVVVSKAGGPPTLITQDGIGVSVTPTGISEPRPLTQQELEVLEELSSEALQQGAPQDPQGEGEGEEEGQGPQEGGGEEDLQEFAAQALAQLGLTETGVVDPALAAALEAVAEELLPMINEIEEQIEQIIASVPDVPDIDVDVDDILSNVTVDNSIDLSSASDFVTVYLENSPKEYSIGEASPITISDDIINVLGATSYENYIYGDANANALTGGNLGDVIEGGAGNDAIYGGTGNDALKGESDNDIMEGGVGQDTLWGGAGIDTIDGGDDADLIYGGDGSGGDDSGDVLSGGDGNDTIYGADATASVDGNDTIDGGAGADSLLGGYGNDSISGGSGNDTMKGEDGNDSLFGGTGDDSILGGDGSDHIFMTTSLTAADTIDGGGFNDTSTYDYLYYTDDGVAGNTDELNNVSSMSHIIFGTAETYVTLDNHYMGDSGSTIYVNGTATTSLAFDASGGNDIYNITGGSGNDTLTGAGLVDTIIGGSGNDIIDGKGGNDILTGGAGSDIFNYFDGTGTDSISDFHSADDSFQLFNVGSLSGSLVNGTSFEKVSAGYSGTETNLAGEGIIFEDLGNGSGRIWYDSNGSTAGGNTLLMNITFDTSGDEVTDADFTTFQT